MDSTMSSRWFGAHYRMVLPLLYLAQTYVTSCSIPCNRTPYPEPFCEFGCSDDMLTYQGLMAPLNDIDVVNRRVQIVGDYPCNSSSVIDQVLSKFTVVPKQERNVSSCCGFEQPCSNCYCNYDCWKEKCEGYDITFIKKQVGIISFNASFTWGNTSSGVTFKPSPPVESRTGNLSTDVKPTSCPSSVCNSKTVCSKHDCPQASCKCRKSKRWSIYIIAGGIALAGGLILVLVFFFALKKRRIQSRRYSDCRAHILADTGGPNPTCFTLKSLKIATKSFSESRLLGGGGFSTVYQGKLPDGRTVAVKKLNQGNKQAIQQFQNEVAILSKVKHANLVQLLGYCLEGRDLLLVYEYLPNGTLADHLHGDMGEVLTIERRLAIALETAKALAYLHFHVIPPIYHRDVKSSNILLDNNFTVKVADFGLSRLTNIDATNISTAPQGTPGYLDPDYHESYQLTDKSDVYSFGVVLLEIVSRKKVVDMTRDRKEINLASMALAKIHCGALHELFDPELSVKYWKILSRVVEVAFRCIATEKDDRPNMLEVVANLEQISSMVMGGSSVKSQDNNPSKSPTLELVGSKKRSLVSCLDQDSPTSVQVKWPSTHTSPNNSRSEI